MNESLLQDVQQGNAVPHQFVDMAKQLNAENDVFAWHDVLAEQDAAELMYVSGAFHDSYIREIKTVLGRPYEPEFKSKLQVSFEMYGIVLTLCWSFRVVWTSNSVLLNI